MIMINIHVNRAIDSMFIAISNWILQNLISDWAESKISNSIYHSIKEKPMTTVLIILLFWLASCFNSHYDTLQFNLLVLIELPCWWVILFLWIYIYVWAAHKNLDDSQLHCIKKQGDIIHSLYSYDYTSSYCVPN